VLAGALAEHLPEQRDVLHLSFALADPDRLERAFASAGFREIHVARDGREGGFASFADYWAPIEAGVGSLPQAYRVLPEGARRAVRETVRARFTEFDRGGRLSVPIEVLIASGRA